MLAISIGACRRHRRLPFVATCLALVASMALSVFLSSHAIAASETVVIKTVAVAEGNAGITNAVFTFSVTRSGSHNVAVHYATTNGTAHAGSDYIAKQGDIVIPDRKHDVTINVVVNGDKIPEPDETFNIAVTGNNGLVASGHATHTILNDDGPVPTAKPIVTPAPPHGTGTTTPVAKSTAPPVATSAPKPATTAKPVATSQPNHATVQPNVVATPKGPTLVVLTESGAHSGAPGSGVVVRGERWTACGEVAVSLGGRQIGTMRPDATGSFVLTGASVPGDAKTGGLAIEGRCLASGLKISAPSTFSVVYASNHRTAFATSIHTLSQISFKPKDLAKSLLPILVLTILLGFVTELFNSTYEENYDEIRSWFRRGKRTPKPSTPARRGATFAFLVVLGGVLCAFITPDAGFNLATVGLVIGMCVGLVLVTVGFDIPNSIAARRQFNERGRITSMPSTVVIAMLCVFASRVVHFEPGLLYGLLAVLTFRREFGDKLEGKLGAIACSGILAMSILAWLAIGPVSRAAQHGSSFWLFTLEATLASICLLGLETVTFVLMPFRFMMGPTIKAWNKYVWFVLFALSGGMYVHVLLRPGLGYVGSNAAVSLSIVLFAVVPIVGSLGFWAYFRFRPDRETDEPMYIDSSFEDPDNFFAGSTAS